MLYSDIQYKIFGDSFTQRVSVFSNKKKANEQRSKDAEGFEDAELRPCSSMPFNHLLMGEDKQDVMQL